MKVDKFVFPGKGSFYCETKFMNRFIEYSFTPSLCSLAIPFVFRNIRNHTPVEYVFPVFF